jgi:hypothetical protein
VPVKSFDGQRHASQCDFQSEPNLFQFAGKLYRQLSQVFIDEVDFLRQFEVLTL